MVKKNVLFGICIKKARRLSELYKKRIYVTYLIQSTSISRTTLLSKKPVIDKEKQWPIARITWLTQLTKLLKQAKWFLSIGTSAADYSVF